MDKKLEIVELIKTTVNKHLADAEVRLFGSRARSDSDSDSDYDILIITEQLLSPMEKFPIKTSIRKELLKSGIRTDILIQSRKDIAVKRNLPGHIIRRILNEAILL
ncbi:MAG: nucleotidyltransferase domain-containing protein [Bacteroidales bacterium]|nr:nucleotidyltransferase domain-containing protein [Bacteroidales bacterium]